ncbi:hypothetical protein R3I94_008183 [Phoxinus phoxinus]|jgi:hypothetical protein
MKGK